MKYAVLLLLDKKSQDKISQTRNRLTKSGVGGEVAAIVPYHITIASLDAENKERFMQTTREFADKQKRFSLSFSSAGTFMTSQNGVYFAPVMTSELSDAHERYNKSLEKEVVSFDEYYKANQWVPHCTLASGIADSEMIKAFELLKQENILPLNAIIDSLCVLQCDQKPYKIIAEYKFF